MTTRLPLLTARIRSEDGSDDETPLARQWRVLKLLVFSPKGFTVKELAALSGISEKTVKRDLDFLKQVGFDVSETVGEFGRKSYRIRRLAELKGRGTVAEKYTMIHDTLGDLHDVALILGDTALSVSLKRLQEWVAGKCHDRKPKPK